MQIHEITKGPRRTDEGILDDLKAAVTATKTGYAQGGLKGVAKNLTSRTAYNQALQQNQRASTNKELNKLEKKWGSKIKRPLSYYADQLKNPTTPEFKDEAQKATQERQQLVPQFVQTFSDEPTTGPGDVLPDPGQVLTVELNKGKYYKTAAGKWYNEAGTALPQTSYAGVEKLIDQDKYTQEPVPPILSGGQVPPVEKTKKTQATTKTAPVAKTQEPDVNEPLGEARAVAQKGSLAQRATSRNAGVPTPQPATPAATSAKKGRANLKSDFGAWITSKLGGEGGDYKKIIDSSPQIKQELTKIFTSMTTQKDPAVAKQLFDKYVLTAQAAMLKARVEGGVSDADAEPSMDDKLAQLRGEPGKKTGNQKLDSLLTQAGIALSESQVEITRDIHVKSPKGDYIKRYKDQQWYDPNGILISQDKYADFVKKLDATPAAQSAYQSELMRRDGGGSDTAAIKNREAAYSKAELDAAVKAAVDKAMAAHPQPTPPPPQATAADWAEHQAEVNRQNNAALAKTMNDLRYAEYFNTGQQAYLQQQAAQLIGTK
jgi:hypothetical protein